MPLSIYEWMTLYCKPKGKNSKTFSIIFRKPLITRVYYCKSFKHMFSGVPHYKLNLKNNGTFRSSESDLWYSLLEEEAGTRPAASLSLHSIISFPHSGQLSPFQFYIIKRQCHGDNRILDNEVYEGVDHIIECRECVWRQLCKRFFLLNLAFWGIKSSENLGYCNL